MLSFRRSKALWVIVMLLLAGACGDGGGDGVDATSAGPEDCHLPTGPYEKSPGEALEGPGWHRIYVQGGESEPLPDGRFGMNELRNLIKTGDHFLLSQGALVEFTYPVVDTLTGHVALHIARTDDPGVVARYELDLVRGGETIELLSLDDPDHGDMGYVPFEGCFFVGRAIEPGSDATLLLRVTNITGGMLGVVVRSPDYWTWVDVEVAE